MSLTDVIFYWSLLRNSLFDSLMQWGQSTASSCRKRTAPRSWEGDSMSGSRTLQQDGDMLTWECVTLRPPAEGSTAALPWDESKINDIDLFVIRTLFIYYSEQNHDPVPLWTGILRWLRYCWPITDTHILSYRLIDTCILIILAELD